MKAFIVAMTILAAMFYALTTVAPAQASRPVPGIPVTDVCPNIDGVQPVWLLGKYYWKNKNTGNCRSIRPAGMRRRDMCSNIDGVQRRYLLRLGRYSFILETPNPWDCRSNPIYTI